MLAQLLVVFYQALMLFEQRLQTLLVFALKDLRKLFKQGFQIEQALPCLGQLLLRQSQP